MNAAVERKLSKRDQAMRTIASTIVALITLSVPVAYGRDYHVGSLDIAAPWSRATPKGASVAAGYLQSRTPAQRPIA